MRRNVLGKIRTLNPQIRSLVLYPIKPQALKKFCSLITTKSLGSIVFHFLFYFFSLYFLEKKREVKNELNARTKKSETEQSVNLFFLRPN